MGVKVIYGADEDEFSSIVGAEFLSAIRVVRDIMGIPTDITDIRLNGKENPVETSILKEGDTITFYKRAGSKGM